MSVYFLKMQNICFELYETKTAVGSNGAIDHVALNVSDIEAVWKLAREANLQIQEKEIQQLPFWKNGIRYFTVLGPNHEVLEFNQIL